MEIARKRLVLCWTWAKVPRQAKDFPPRQKVGSFSLDQVLETLQTGKG